MRRSPEVEKHSNPARIPAPTRLFRLRIIQAILKVHFAGSLCWDEKEMCKQKATFFTVLCRLPAGDAVGFTDPIPTPGRAVYRKTELGGFYQFASFRDAGYTSTEIPFPRICREFSNG